MDYQAQVAANVRAEAERYRVPVGRMAAALGIRETAMYSRLNGTVQIKLNEIPALAQVIGVPMARLTAWEGTKDRDLVHAA